MKKRQIINTHETKKGDKWNMRDMRRRIQSVL